VLVGLDVRVGSMLQKPTQKVRVLFQNRKMEQRNALLSLMVQGGAILCEDVQSFEMLKRASYEGSCFVGWIGNFCIRACFE
jgi:hypothetical protein